MKAVYYSLVLTAEPTVHQNQWIRSIGSLRRFNTTIPVHLFLFNEPTPAILEKADECEVIVHRLGSYRDCLREIGGEEGAALSCIPTLNKLIPLGYFAQSVSQVLFLDCDTFFFGDVATLFAKYQARHLYARETPHSRRSVFLEYRPSEIDEDALDRIAADRGTRPVPPYNTGVILLNQGVSADLFALRKEFLRYAWRLILGASLSPDMSLPLELRNFLATMPLNRLGDPIKFPSKNYWILDEIALSLTLGRIPDLSHGQFPMEDVLQNGEFMIYRSYRTKCTVVHYLRGNEALFLKDTEAEARQSTDPD
jgi:hypothetical protein